MTARARRSGRLLSLGLSALLLLAGRPDAYGLHQCAHHPSRAPSGQAVHDASDAGHPESGRAPAGSCSTVVDCPVCLGWSPRFPGSAARIQEPVDQLVAERVDPALCPLGPRHLLFELHLPNAPPLHLLRPVRVGENPSRGDSFP